MELTDSFALAVPVDELWEALIDVERIAPCVPGFKLEEAADPEYRGTMTVKVGAVTVRYDATITFVEKDEGAHRAVLAVTGTERKGGGGVDATVTATLNERGSETEAEMVTDVDITGRVAQFGRGIIADVGSRLTKQFVERLTSRVLAEPAATAAPAGSADSAGAPVVPAATEPEEEEDDVVNLGAVAFVPAAKRVLPVVAVVLVVVVVLVLVLR